MSSYIICAVFLACSAVPSVGLTDVITVFFNKYFSNFVTFADETFAMAISLPATYLFVSLSGWTSTLTSFIKSSSFTGYLLSIVFVSVSFVLFPNTNCCIAKASAVVILSSPPLSTLEASICISSNVVNPNTYFWISNASAVVILPSLLTSP